MTETTKGGKPNPATPADRRLAENKPKPAFPGARPPMKPRPPKK